MRILAAVISSALVLLLVKAYLAVDQSSVDAAPHVATLENAAGTYRLELELSFDAGPDRFSTDLSTASSVTVRFAGKVLYQTDQPVVAGEKIAIPNVGDVIAGRNEFLIEATPQNPGPPLFAKASIYSSEQQEPIAERFVWAPAGAALLSGVANFSATAVAPPNAGAAR